MSKEELLQLLRVANEFIASFADTKNPPPWGRPNCYQVRYWTDHEGDEGCTVHLQRVRADGRTLSEMLTKYLRDKHGVTVEVLTEW